MEQDLIAQAEAAFAEALKFDEKRARFESEHKVSPAATARRAVDKHLERAVALEAAAFAPVAAAV